MDNLQYIRRTLERAGEFTAVPGKGGVLMGVVGVVASRLAVQQRSAGGWLAVWTYAAIVAMAIGIAGAALKSRRFRTPVFSGPGRKFIAGFAPSLLAGISGFLPGVWLLLYGAAVLAGGYASVRVVPIMGVCFMLVGTVALFLPGWNDVLLPVGFGGLHLIFGTVIAVKYGG
jgi:hypothetical protein